MIVCRWRYRSVLAVTLLLLAICMRPRPTLAATDVVRDAKRKAAAQLLREGKASDAVALLTEVINTDGTHYADHLLMARSYEKLTETVEAAKQYRMVIDLLPGTLSSVDERAAKVEAEKKIKQLDPMATKIDGVVDDYLRKLDTLEREAVAARSMATLERIFRLRGMTWQAEKAKDRAYIEVFPDMNHGVWQHSGLELKEKHSYRVRAAGTWRIRGNGGPDSFITCTAAGTDQRKSADYPYKIGALQGQVNGKLFNLGEDLVFIAPASGELLLFESDLNAETRAKNSGSLQVLITTE